MTPARLEAYRTALECALAAISKRRDAVEIVHEIDALDAATALSERERAALVMTREAQRAKAIVAALDRIKDGSFGTCLECDEEISAGRLAALPYASRCALCQGWKEKEAV